MGFLSGRISIAWNVSIRRWYYLKNLELLQVSTLGIGNDSKRTEISVNIKVQVTPELQHRMKTGIWQQLPKEAEGAQHPTSLFSCVQRCIRQFEGKP
ncbi:uncharacterized protein TNCV_3709701 [Trichonephila clavipes]|nr:uncharacterized protein TNCV_3709701 [Trichonephila clavipes]